MAENRKVLISLKDLKMHFPLKRTDVFDREKRYVKAVDGVSVDIYEGETFGLVGESGCGKSTLGRVILQLYNQTAGSVRYKAVSIDEKAPKYLSQTFKDILKLQKIDAAQILKDYPDCAALAGGLLCCKDLQKLVSLLTEKYEAVSNQNKIEEKINIIELKLSALKEADGELEKDAQKAEALKKQLEGLNGYLKELKAETAAKDASVEVLREGCENEPGYKQLEEALDHSIDLSRLSSEEMRVLLSDLQMVFQDPYSSLNPRLTVGQLIAEALVAHNVYKRGTKQMEKYTLGIMEKCGLQAYMLHRYPHQFSGGQRQRIGIARSLALKPKFVVCDEAVSALDVSIQSQIINLLMDLKEQENLTYLFISHDLSAVKFISDRIGVMYLGNIIELAGSETIFDAPLHPYTEALIDAIPTTEDESNKELQTIEGDIPSPINPPSGCKFHTRCKYAADKCKQEVPEWREWRKEHYVACHFPLGEKQKS